MSGLAVIAGLISTIIFASSMLPMIVKAVRTRDLQSYSLGNLMLVNGGNAIHSLYVFSLPAGPIWVLHSCHVATSVLMLVWYLRFAGRDAHHRKTSCPSPRHATVTVETMPAPPLQATAIPETSSLSPACPKPTNPTTAVPEPSVLIPATPKPTNPTFGPEAVALSTH
jgi:uncharacterized protein with PQ loop repeat